MKYSISGGRLPGACLAMALALSGCATQSGSQEADAMLESAETPEVVEVDIAAASGASDTPAVTLPSPDDYPVAPFQGDALYQLLVAEVAGYRSDYDLALQNYLAATLDTRDPGVAARATRLALYLKQDDTARQTAAIWAESDPLNIEAHRHAADLYVRAGMLEEAMGHMEAVKNLGGLAKFDVFAYRSAGLESAERESLLTAISEMLLRHPDDEQLVFSKAVLLERSGRLDEALALTDQLIERSDNVNVTILRMTILGAMGRAEEARNFLAARVELMPDNRRLRLILARMLFEQGDLEAAKSQYQHALTLSQNDGDVLFALALIALEQKDDLQAREYFEKMVRWNRRPGEAHYYLGSIAERLSDKVSALKEYRQVGTGYEFLPAQARIASILVGDGRWEEAREHLERMRAQMPGHAQQLMMIEAQLLADRGMSEEVFEFLDRMLAQEPENVDLLYFRAMTGQRFDRLDILEQDLRQVILLDPENADAMNALGYTLTDQTDRHEEALDLIERALSIKPDEPAFIDSMGWVQFRLKNYDTAIEYLTRALSLFKNDEVAAHLGEVHWVIGEHEKAREVWSEALKLAPDSEILKTVIERLTGAAPGSDS